MTERSTKTAPQIKGVVRVLQGDQVTLTDGYGYWAEEAQEPGYQVTLASTCVFLSDEALARAAAERVALDEVVAPDPDGQEGVS